MGLIWSLLGWEAEDPAENEPDPATGLTPKQKKAIQQSWAPLRKNMKPVGLAFFSLFFTTYPNYKKLFPTLIDVPSDKLKTSTKVQAHGTTFMLAVTNIVEHVDEPEVLVTLCEKLGESHKKHGLKEKDFRTVVALFLKFFSENFPEGVTYPKEFVCEAWTKAFDVIVKVVSTKL